jgi:hypothetical protein
MTDRPITSPADVVAIFNDLAAIFRHYGKHVVGEPLAVQVEQWKFKSVKASAAGAFDCIEGPDLVVYHRPEKREGFGWMRRMDIRRGSPTALLALLNHLKAKGMK